MDRRRQLKNRILEWERQSGKRDLKLRRWYNRMLRGGYDDIFKPYYDKLDGLVRKLSVDERKQDVSVENKEKTSIESTVKLMKQWTESFDNEQAKYLTIKREEKQEEVEQMKKKLNALKQDLNNQLIEILKSCFENEVTEGQPGYYYKKLTEENTDIDVVDLRRLWIRNLTVYLHQQQEKIKEDIYYQFRYKVSQGVEPFRTSPTTVIVTDDNFGEIFTKETQHGKK